ncbi:MAG: hypothetical protein ACRCZR_02705 [Cetobacterium sp.]
MINNSDYFDDVRIKEKECLVSNPKKKFVFKEEVNGEVFFIKKYTPHGRRAVRINLFLKKDMGLHYKYISDLLKKIEIPHVEAFAVEIRKKSFFKRETILVTKYGGEVLEEKLRELNINEQKELLNIYFDYFIKMFKNGIYVTDYNLSGALIDEKNRIKLIDFDAYKKRFFLTNKLKKRIVEEIYKHHNLEALGGYSQKFVDYTEYKIEAVLKELKLKS